jgi:hypothetical protein
VRCCTAPVANYTEALWREPNVPGCDELVAHIQIDAPRYPVLLDPRTRAFYEARGWALDRWLRQGIEMDNAVIGDFPEVTFGFHL